MNFSQFPLFQSHLDLAHHYWKRIIHPADTLIDATCGNGYDTLALAQLINKEEDGNLIAIDIQLSAIEATKIRLSNYLSPQEIGRVRFIHGCHSHLPDDLKKESVGLIVYNLGYLPGSSKIETTRCGTTLDSLKAALPLIRPGGAISITCYPGHAEGKREEDAIKQFLGTLSPRIWSCCYHSWINRSNAPSLVMLQHSQEAKISGVIPPFDITAEILNPTCPLNSSTDLIRQLRWRS